MPVFAGLFLIVDDGLGRVCRRCPASSASSSRCSARSTRATRSRRPRRLPAGAAPARRARRDRRDPRRDLPAVHVPEGVLRQARQGEERQAAGPAGGTSSSCSSRSCSRSSSLGLFPRPLLAVDGAVACEKFRRRLRPARVDEPDGPPHLYRAPTPAPAAPRGGRRSGHDGRCAVSFDPADLGWLVAVPDPRRRGHAARARRGVLQGQGSHRARRPRGRGLARVRDRLDRPLPPARRRARSTHAARATCWSPIARGYVLSALFAVDHRARPR